MAAPAVRFAIEMVFDLPQRAGLLASGTVTGHLAKGTVLQDPETGVRTTVLAVEFATPRDLRTGRTTLLLERTDPTPVVTGRILTSQD